VSSREVGAGSGLEFCLVGVADFSGDLGLEFCMGLKGKGARSAPFGSGVQISAQMARYHGAGS